jgi:hypothetical protein
LPIELGSIIADASEAFAISRSRAKPQTEMVIGQ